MFIQDVKKMNEILKKVDKKPRKKKQNEIFEMKPQKKRNYNRERKRKVEVRARTKGRKDRVRRANQFY